MYPHSTIVHDKLAEVYDSWLSGDDAAQSCARFYFESLERAPGKVLELGAGTGRICNMLWACGVDIVGLDHSLPMLDAAASCSDAGHSPLVQATFKHLPFAEAFETVICPMRTIGHLLTPLDRRTVFSEVRRVLRPAGRFIFDHYNIDLVWARAHDGIPRLMYAGRDGEREDRALHIWDRYDYDFAARTLSCTVLIEYLGIHGALDEASTVHFDFRWFSYEELASLAGETGFRVDACYGSFEREPYVPEAEHMVWVLSKA